MEKQSLALEKENLAIAPKGAWRLKAALAVALTALGAAIVATVVLLEDVGAPITFHTRSATSLSFTFTDGGSTLTVAQDASTGYVTSFRISGVEASSPTMLVQVTSEGPARDEITVFFGTSSYVHARGANSTPGGADYTAAANAFFSSQAFRSLPSLSYLLGTAHNMSASHSHAAAYIHLLAMHSAQLSQRAAGRRLSDTCSNGLLSFDCECSASGCCIDDSAKYSKLVGTGSKPEGVGLNSAGGFKGECTDGGIPKWSNGCGLTGEPSSYANHDQGCDGLCGPYCDCWSWACDDCCDHELCRWHDKGCARHGDAWCDTEAFHLLYYKSEYGCGSHPPEHWYSRWI